MIRAMLTTDSEAVLQIYKLGLDSKNATFETQVPLWSDWDKNHHLHSRFVYCIDKNVVGWVALSPTSKRKVYEGVAEISIYIHPNYFGKGIGTQLMQKAILSSEENGIWTLYSSIFPENEATLQLHLKNGFTLIGKREKIAKLDEEWRDTLLLEKRSEKFT